MALPASPKGGKRCPQCHHVRFKFVAACPKCMDEVLRAFDTSLKVEEQR